MPFAWTRRSLLAGACTAAVLAVAVTGATAKPSPAPKGPAVLTVAGDIAHVNRGPVDPKLDGVFRYHEIEFDKAFAFDRAMLEALPQVTFEAQLPEGHEKATFSGPRLADVLAMAGPAQGAGIAARALDGYVTELSAEDLAGKEWIAVLARNGAGLGIGGFGPVMLLAKPAAIKVGDDDPWPWAVFYIEVTKK